MSSSKKISLILMVMMCMGLWFFSLAAHQKSEPGSPPLRVTSLQIQTNEGEIELLVQGSGFSSDIRATTWASSGNRQAIVSALPTWGLLHGLALKEETAFLANHFRGVQAIDMRRPDEPRIIGSVATDDRAWDIALQNGFAFVADGEGGLQVIDIEDAENLRRTASLPLPGACFAITLERHFALLSSGSNGLHVVDISDPTEPVLLCTLDLGNVVNLLAYGDTLYASSLQEGLKVIDFSNPASPRIVFRIEERCSRAFRNGNILYISGPDDHLSVYDISEPRRPVFLNSQPIQMIQALQIKEDRGYAAMGKGGLVLLDLSLPEKPKENKRVNIGGIAYDLALGRNLALVARGSKGLTVIDLEKITDRDASLQFGKDSGALAIRNDQLILAGDIFKIFDIKEDGALRPLSDCPLPLRSRKVDLFGENAFVYQLKGRILQLDIADPEHPAIAGGLENHRMVLDLAENADHIFMAVEKKILIFKKTSSAPRLLTSFSVPGVPTCIALRDDRLFVGSDLGLFVMDIADPVNPTIRAHVDLPWHVRSSFNRGDMALDGDRLFLVNRSSGLLAINRIDSEEPHLSSILDTPGFSREIIIDGSWAYILDQKNGIQVVDIQDPYNMQIIATLDGWWYIEGMAKKGKWLYLSTPDEGLFACPEPRELELSMQKKGEVRFMLPTADLLPGRYTLRIFQGKEEITFPAAVEIAGHGGSIQNLTSAPAQN